jgi:hypothetical protein
MSPSISTKAPQLMSPGARRRPDHFGDFEMAAYQRSIFGRASTGTIRVGFAGWLLVNYASMGSNSLHFR